MRTLGCAAGAWILASGFADAFAPHVGHGGARAIIKVSRQERRTNLGSSFDPTGPVDAQGKWRPNDMRVDTVGHAPSTPIADQLFASTDAVYFGSTWGGSAFASPPSASSPAARPERESEVDRGIMGTRRSDLQQKWKPPVGYVPQRYRDLSPEREPDMWSAHQARMKGDIEPTIGERLVLLKLILSKIAHDPSARGPNDLR